MDSRDISFIYYKLMIILITTINTIVIRMNGLKLVSRNIIGNYDLAIIGGGIVGIATGRQILLDHPQMRVVILEKEKQLGLHQTGHNSGVIHSGVYYKPGSLIAELCVRGADLVYKYLDEKKLPYRKCGKVIVAVKNEEIERLNDLFERALLNKVKDVKMIKRDEILNIEPSLQGGLLGIHCPHTGIVDWRQFALSLAEDFIQMGGVVNLESEVVKIESQGDNVQLVTANRDKSRKSYASRFIIACAGLQSDRIASLSGGNNVPKIIPIRGNYLMLSKEKSQRIRGNIYPVPDPNLPFLGMHFTPRMDGGVWMGPNAMPAFNREGYSSSNISIKDTLEWIRYPGFYKLATSYWRFGLTEIIRSIILPLELRQLQKYIPDLEMKDLKRGPTGVRAQALSMDGTLIQDFIFETMRNEDGKENILHVRNAPSPAATSCLAIGQAICEKATKTFML